ncbi:MAG: hypothetical protein NZ744_05310, partial [Pirellulaceae bacterium]|nr:hypothetical protein [Pirellulaceae bacterium]
MKNYLASFVCLFSFVAWTVAQEPPKPEFPPHATVLNGYEKIVSTADGARSMYTLWTRSKDGQVYAELPPTFAQ